MVCPSISNKGDVFTISTFPLSNIYTSCNRTIFHPLVFRSGSTSDDLHQLARNDSLSRPVVQDGEPVDHVACVFRCVIHGVPAGGDLASVAFSQCPVDAVGQGVLTHVGKDFVVDLEGGEVGWECMVSSARDRSGSVV